MRPSQKLWRQAKQRARHISVPIFVCVLALSVLGILMQYSAAGGQMQPWAKPQLARFILGFSAFIVMSLLPLKFYIRLAYPVYFACLALLVAVELAGFVGMGAQRWISLGGVNVQPSEFMKLALIVALARYFHMVRQEDVSHPLMLLPPLAMIGVPAMLILVQPNLGTATIISFVGVVMLFMAGINWKYFAALVLMVAIAIPVGWQFLHDYQKQRVMTFMDPGKDPLGAGYNITQSIIAIGSGGFAGKGFLHGSQAQLDFLPEKQTDFIFTMIAEELGFVGALLVLAMFTVLIGFGMALMVRPKSRFAGMIAAGFTAMMFAHIFINMAMVMGMIPVVGVPLPFLSYGGTFLLACLLASGLLMNVYVNRDVTLHKNIPAL